ncbi:MAG: ABC transporter permease, partial [Gemmatimonadota bacterium]
MASLLNDIRLAFRLILKNRTFSLIVVATLALGIGLNTAVFSAVDALLLRPLPGVRDAGQLVQIYRTWPGTSGFGSNSIPHYLDIRERSKDVFTDVVAWSFVPINLSADGRPQRIMGQVVSANYFSVLGVPAFRGRTFVAQEDSGRRAHPVVVLSYAGWRKEFGSDPNVVGKSVIVDGQNYQVVGVAPEEFKGGIPVVSPVLWAPLTQVDHLQPGSNKWESRGSNSLNVIGRLKPGVTIAQANQRMTAIVADLRRIYPDDYKDSGINLVLQSDAGIHPMFKSAQLGLTSVIMGVVLLLLLIACVNVANLMLARARDRAREMAVRLSLGAQRGALIRQLLTESLLLSGIAGAVGLLVALWAIRIANLAVGSLPAQVELSPNLTISPLVLVFTLAISVVTGIIFGLAPALQATRPALIPALKGEAPSGGSRSRMSKGLVVAQIALSIVLLVSAGLFLQNLKAATA